MLSLSMTQVFKTKKSLGQHFLTSSTVPGWLAEAANIETGDTVLEIGPGTGVLTKELLARKAKVVALEADQRAINVLKENFLAELNNGQLDVRHVDVRKLDLPSLGLENRSFKVVANIPYYLTGQLFRLFLAGEIQPSTLVFLVQKEVAKRATASLSNGGRESLLSLSIKAFGSPRYIKSVGKGHFNPPPKVDSAIIAVENIGKTNFTEIDIDDFFELLHLGFGSKRKQLLGNLAKKYKRDDLENVFNHLNISLDTRAEDVELHKWLELTNLLEN